MTDRTGYVCRCGERCWRVGGETACGYVGDPDPTLGDGNPQSVVGVPWGPDRTGHEAEGCTCDWAERKGHEHRVWCPASYTTRNNRTDHEAEVEAALVQIRGIAADHGSGEYERIVRIADAALAAVRSRSPQDDTRRWIIERRDDGLEITGSPDDGEYGIPPDPGYIEVMPVARSPQDGLCPECQLPIQDGEHQMGCSRSPQDEDRSAGRWCEVCGQHGGHHTDRHPQDEDRETGSVKLFICRRSGVQAQDCPSPNYACENGCDLEEVEYRRVSVPSPQDEG